MPPRTRQSTVAGCSRCQKAGCSSHNHTDATCQRCLTCNKVYAHHREDRGHGCPGTSRPSTPAHRPATPRQVHARSRAVSADLHAASQASSLPGTPTTAGLSDSDWARPGKKQNLDKHKVGPRPQVQVGKLAPVIEDTAAPGGTEAPTNAAPQTPSSKQVDETVHGRFDDSQVLQVKSVYSEPDLSLPSTAGDQNDEQAISNQASNNSTDTAGAKADSTVATGPNTSGTTAQPSSEAEKDSCVVATNGENTIATGEHLDSSLCKTSDPSEGDAPTQNSIVDDESDVEAVLPIDPESKPTQQTGSDAIALRSDQGASKETEAAGETPVLHEQQQQSANSDHPRSDANSARKRNARRRSSRLICTVIFALLAILLPISAISVAPKLDDLTTSAVEWFKSTFPSALYEDLHGDNPDQTQDDKAMNNSDVAVVETKTPSLELAENVKHAAISWLVAGTYDHAFDIAGFRDATSQLAQALCQSIQDVQRVHLAGLDEMENKADRLHAKKWAKLLSEQGPEACRQMRKMERSLQIWRSSMVQSSEILLSYVTYSLRDDSDRSFVDRTRDRICDANWRIACHSPPEVIRAEALYTFLNHIDRETSKLLPSIQATSKSLHLLLDAIFSVTELQAKTNSDYHGDLAEKLEGIDWKQLDLFVTLFQSRRIGTDDKAWLTEPSLKALAALTRAALAITSEVLPPAKQLRECASQCLDSLKDDDFGRKLARLWLPARFGKSVRSWHEVHQIEGQRRSHAGMHAVNLADYYLITLKELRGGNPEGLGSSYA